MLFRSFASRAGTVAVLGAVALAAFAWPASAAPTQRTPAAGAQNVFAYGRASFFGSTGAGSLSHQVVGIAASPSGRGYRLVASDGGMFAFGDARFLGSTGAMHLNEPIVGMASTPSGRGYWLVASDGGMFAFGDARYLGSTGAMHLNEPIVGMASTPSGRGYWLVASDGGMFAFGDARYLGSTGAMHLNEPIVGMASTPSGRGYWLVASDGGMFAFGNAHFRGSSSASGQRIVGMAATRSGRGYWLASDNGRVFAFGDAAHLTRAGPRGSAAVTAKVAPGSIVGIAANGTTHGFWLAGDGGAGRKVEAAIAWFESRLGATAYEGRCETTVELAYGTIEKYPSASADWRAQSNKHLDWWNAPRGSLVFYATSADGHVAISLGNGQVVSSSVNHHIDVAPIGFFQNPLGWAPEPW